jgi:hypothetical protein
MQDADLVSEGWDNETHCPEGGEAFAAERRKGARLKKGLEHSRDSV